MIISRLHLNETTLTAVGDSLICHEQETLLDNSVPILYTDVAAATPSTCSDLEICPVIPSVLASVNTEPCSSDLDSGVPKPPGAEQAESCSQSATGSETSDLSAKLQKAFDGLLGGNSDGSFEEMARKERVIVSLDKLLQLFGGSCDTVGCEKQKQVDYRIQGGVVVISWNCGGGHGGVWESSDVLVHKKGGQKVYANTVMLAASILVTGNNFSKTSLFSRCLNLGFISSATFERIQKLYAIPAIQSFWSDMRKVIHDVMKNERVVLSGDGRNDSPGFSAQYCVYSLMEAVTKVIVDLEIKDKRETGGRSTVMEVAALKCLLERLIETPSIGELTTDASTSVIAMVKKLKGKYC